MLVAARIARWNEVDAVGVLTLPDGRSVRFGQTACRDFVPRVGLDVHVEGLSPHPLGGLRADVVRVEPITEEAALARAAAEETARVARALAPWDSLAGALPRWELPPEYVPGTDEVSSLLDARTRELLLGLARLRSHLDHLGPLVPENPPWPFHDPCLRAVGADGGGNVYALHVHPAVAAAGRPAPVVFWDHDLHAHLFVAPDLETFLAGYLHRQLADEESRPEATWVAKALGVEPRPVSLDERWDPDERDWPFPTLAGVPPIPLAGPIARERDLVADLVEATHGTPEDALLAVTALHAAYAELGWVAQRNGLHHQVAEWLDDQRARAAAKR